MSLAAHLYTDLLWYRELGQEAAFWTTLKWKVLGRGVPGFGTACFLLANFGFVERGMAAHAPLRPLRRLAYPLAAAAGGLINGHWRAGGDWHLLALWAGRSDFGVTDPLFHRDVGFFVFSLPFYEQLSRWFLDALVMAAVVTVGAYLAAGGLRVTRPRVLVPAARTHLLGLGALALLVMAWRYRLDQFALALPHHGATLPGAGYAETHVRLPALRILTLMSLAGALLLLYSAMRRVPRRPLTLLAVLGALALAAPGVVARVVERVEVDPQALSRERPYLAHSIAATREAFDLDGIRVRSLTGGGKLSAREIRQNRRTLANLPLWDLGVLKPAMADLQSIGRYYSFPSLTLDRYAVAGGPQVVTVAARNVDLRALGRDARGWANDRFAYTHGYGVVAVSPQADPLGQPRFTEHDFGSRSNQIGLREPRVYYSEHARPVPPYLIVRSRRAEVDLPAPGSDEPGYHYTGDGGIALSNPLRRAAFAARFGDIRLLLTETITDRSRIILRRDVGERLRTLVPFLDWDSDPQTTVIGGRVQYLFHGYTTSSHYPYSRLVRIGGRRVNYMRAAAYASVDAFSGRVSVYAGDSAEPVLRAWREAFPGLFLPFSRMPDEMRAHLRYPRRLFDVQAAVYATYHAGETTAFWNGADAWQRPQQIAGPVEVAGEIHFPDPARIDADERREKGLTPERLGMDSRYLLARLPGDRRERFMLVTPFTPRGRLNLVSYLAGSIGDDGRPRLVALSLPRDRLTLGPAQATRRILANPEISRRLQLVNRESRDLGKAAVSRTVLGAPRVVPVGDSLVHVQPVYLSAGGDGVPRLQLVTVCANGRVGFGPDLESALRRAVRRRHGPETAPAPARAPTAVRG